MNRIGVLIVDDHPAVRSGLAAFIGYQPDMLVVGEAATGDAAVELYLACSPDVTLMDLSLRGMDGWTAIANIRRHDPNARILAISSLAGDEDVHRALKSGASGYVMKDAEATEIVAAILAVMAGQRYIPLGPANALAARLEYEPLTVRETQILERLARGASNKEIGESLSLAENTVKWHVKTILSKLRAGDRTAAVTVAVRRGLIRL